MGPELALAIDACVSESSSLLVSIGKKINEVRKFKKKCLKLGSEATILLRLLDKNRVAIESLQTLQDFKSCLQEIDAFVDASKSFSWIDSSWEVFWKHTYRSLRKRIVVLKEVFIFESVTEILDRQSSTAKAVNEKQETLLEGQKSQFTILVGLQKAAKAREQSQGQPFGSPPVSDIKTDFVLEDTSLIQFDSSDASVGHGTLESIGKVVCYKIALSSSTQGNLKIYKDIQAGAYVQRLYGTLKAGEDYFVVMQDLDETQTLGKACRENSLPREPLAQLGLAYDLAKTMAWYHRAELLLKSVADHNIVLKQITLDRIAPFLTRLENARHILEQTTGIVYDTRYEAPEFEKLREHSRATDVWSLGTVIWQCICGKSPYGIDRQVLPEDEEYPSIRKMLDNGQLPGSFDEDEGPVGLADIVGQCWNKDPFLRPTAAGVAEALLNIRTVVSLTSSPETKATTVNLLESEDTTVEYSKTLGDARRKALQAIKSARELNNKSRVFVQAPQKLSGDELHLILNEGDDGHPSDSFLAGALIWWNLSDGVSEEEASMGPSVMVTEEGRRARLALTYLEASAQNGYQEAYLELFKAHASIAREFQQRTPKKSPLAIRVTT